MEANVFSGPVILASVGVSYDPQPNSGVAVNVQPVAPLGNRITVATVWPAGASLCVLDAAQAKMLIEDLAKALAALQRLHAGSPSGAVQ